MSAPGTNEPGSAQPSSREAILEAARTLFGDRGYRAVTVRDIAASAGCSPALVIKHFGSKEKLFAQCGPDDALNQALTVPRSDMGEALVFRVLMRRERGLPEPWCTIPQNVREVPDSSTAMADAQERLLAWLAERIGDTTPARRHAAVVCALLVGLAEGARTLGLFTAPGWEFDDAVRHYGAIVQREIDSCG